MFRVTIPLALVLMLFFAAAANRQLRLEKDRDDVRICTSLATGTVDDFRREHKHGAKAYDDLYLNAYDNCARLLRIRR